LTGAGAEAEAGSVVAAAARLVARSVVGRLVVWVDPDTGADSPAGARDDPAAGFVNLVVGMGITGRDALLAGMSGRDEPEFIGVERIPGLDNSLGAAAGPSSGRLGKSVSSDRGGGTRVLDPAAAMAGSAVESIPVLRGRFRQDDEPSSDGSCSYLELEGTYRVGGLARVGSYPSCNWLSFRFRPGP
jgi:hypothetical protein